MPWGLKRFQQSKQTHFVTFSCYHRRPLLCTNAARRTFDLGLERVRRRYRLNVYGYVVMPEHVHLLLSEPEVGTLAVALKALKQGIGRKLVGDAKHFWQKRYYDFNIRDYRQFVEKLRYIHRNPVKQGLCAHPADWSGAAFASTPLDAKGGSRSSASGPQESVNGQQARSVRRLNCPTQAETGLEWATRHPPKS